MATDGGELWLSCVWHVIVLTRRLSSVGDDIVACYSDEVLV